MTGKRRSFLLLFLGLFLLISCGKNIPCSDDFITPAFIGFKSTDLDTIIVRKFEKDGSFQRLIDTAVLSFDTAYLRSVSTNDTTIVLLNFIVGEEKYLFPHSDWQIYLPSPNRTFSISDIVITQKTTPCFKCGCLNPINSFELNTQRTIPQLGKIPYLGGSYSLSYMRN